MERIDISLAANDAYFCGLFVTACSIAKNAAREYALRFTIFDGGISQAHWELLRLTIGNLHPTVEMNPIVVDEELFAEYPCWHGNKMAYARLLLPQLLPDAEWCVYCDVDYTWYADVSELWKERDARFAIISTTDGVQATVNSEEKWFKEHGLPFDREHYFCSGLCFLNLAYFREHKLVDQVFSFLDKYPDVHLPDQNALNHVTDGLRKMVSRRWQQFSINLTAVDFQLGVAIHHGGEVPWKPMGPRQPLTDARLAWHQMNAVLRRISVWQSLRDYFSVGHILSHALVTLLFRCSLSRHALRIVIERLLHRRHVYENYVKLSAKKMPKRGLV